VILFSEFPQLKFYFFKMKARVLQSTHVPTCIAILFFFFNFLEIYLSGFNSHNAICIYQQLHIIRIIKDLMQVWYHGGFVRIMTIHRDFLKATLYSIVWFHSDTHLIARLANSTKHNFSSTETLYRDFVVYQTHIVP